MTSVYDEFVGAIRAVEPDRRRWRAVGVVHRVADRRPPRCLDIDTGWLLSVMASVSAPAGGMGWVQSWDIAQLVPPEIPWKVVAAKLYKLTRSGLLDGCNCGCRGDFTLTRRGIERIESRLSPVERVALVRYAQLARP